MTKEKWRRDAVRCAVCALCLCFILAGCAGQMADGTVDPESWAQLVESQKVVAAKVVSVDSEEYSNENGEEMETTLFTAEITGGSMKGARVAGRLVVYSFMGYRVAPLRPGSRIYLQPSTDENGQPIGEFSDYDRTIGLGLIVALFAVVLCVVGGMKGFRSLVALVLTCGGLALIFVPWVQRGGNPVGASLLVCALVTIITLVIIGGFRVKTASALLGILTGLVTSGILVVIMQGAMRLTGLVDNEAIRLSQMSGMERLSMNGLMFAAILIGALGAAMDVAVSLTSAMEELYLKGNVSGLELVRSGMKIGRDMMGTMTNTLVLAYVGGSLHLVMLLATDLSQFGYTISWELLSTEILRAISGSIGLIVIVPATSVISALLYRRKAGADNPFA